MVYTAKHVQEAPELILGRAAPRTCICEVGASSESGLAAGAAVLCCPVQYAGLAAACDSKMNQLSETSACLEEKTSQASLTM